MSSIKRTKLSCEAKGLLVVHGVTDWKCSQCRMKGLGFRARGFCACSSCDVAAKGLFRKLLRRPSKPPLLLILPERLALLPPQFF